MAITPQQVKELREKTGAGMADCKKALQESDGNMEAAVEYLRKKGAASAAKRVDRSTNEGLIVTRVAEDGGSASIVEVNCETDFVARNEEFIDFVNKLADATLEHNPQTEAELMASQTGGKTIGDLYNETLAKFNEKIIIKRFELFTTDGQLFDYIHVGNKLGVILEISHRLSDESVYGGIRDISMQVAAMSPRFVSREDVDQQTLEKEKEIYIEQAVQSGKPQEIAERIANGRLEKYYQENCLVDQTFVKDSGKTVSDVLKDISKSANEDIRVVRFRRYFLGEDETSN